MIWLCNKCRHFEYYYLDEDGLCSGGCCTDVAFPNQMRKKRCYKFQLLSKVENEKLRIDRLFKIKSIRFYHFDYNEMQKQVLYRSGSNTIQRLKGYLEEYLFHRDLPNLENLI